MRILGCLFLGLLLPASVASSQVRVRSGARIDVRSPRTRKVKVRLPSRGVRVLPPRRHEKSPRGRRLREARQVRRHHATHCRCCGHWKTVRERVWIPPIYEWRRDACGRAYRVLVRHGHYRWVTRRVWVRHH